MSREINFRIRSGNDFYYTGDLCQVKTFNLDLKSRTAPAIWQECTETKDKMGKPIYEGDVLCLEMGYVKYFYEVKFGSFKSEDYSATGFYLKIISKTRPGNTYPFSLTSLSNCKYSIVGNIFDNPELLKEA